MTTEYELNQSLAKKIYNYWQERGVRTINGEPLKVWVDKYQYGGEGKRFTMFRIESNIILKVPA